MRRLTTFMLTMVAMAAAAAPASASWHPAGGTIKFDVVKDVASDMTSYAHYKIRAEVWGDARTGAGMAARNAYMDHAQDAVVVGDYGRPINLRFWYLGHIYRGASRIRPVGFGSTTCVTPTATTWAGTCA
jgi:hypothetical protein